MFPRIAAGARPLYAIFGNSAVALASLLLSVAVARVSTVDEFASFAFAMALFLFVSGLSRAAFTDTALAEPDDAGVLRRSFRRASLIALGSALLTLVVGLMIGNVYLVVLGATYHGLVALDFVRTFDSAVGSARRAFWLSACWASATGLGSTLWIVGGWTPLPLFIAWATVGGTTGYVAVAITALPWQPGWPRERKESRAALIFSGDYVVGSGGAALTSTLVGFAATSAVIAALRGAGTLLGPANLIASTARSLLIPALSRASRARSELRLAVKVTMVLAAIVAPVLGVIQFLPYSWGTWLLGDVWAVAVLALLPLTIESFFGMLSGIPAAGHRAVFAGRRALILRLAVGVPRPFIVLAAAFVGGVAGAAWSMAALAVINTIVWWLSFVQLQRRGGSPKVHPSEGGNGG